MNYYNYCYQTIVEVKLKRDSFYQFIHHHHHHHCFELIIKDIDKPEITQHEVIEFYCNLSNRSMSPTLFSYTNSSKRIIVKSYRESKECLQLKFLFSFQAKQLKRGKSKDFWYLKQKPLCKYYCSRLKIFHS